MRMLRSFTIIVNLLLFVLICGGISYAIMQKRNGQQNKDIAPQTSPIVLGETVENKQEKVVPNNDGKEQGEVEPHKSSDININNELETSKKIPILYYHAVNDEAYGFKQLFVRPFEFEKQMKYVSENYTPIHFADLNDMENISNPIIVTLDDGYRDNYTYAFPVFKKYNIKATIFLVPDYLHASGYLSEQHIDEMKGLVSFQSHTMTHKELDTASIDELEEEVKNSKSFIEELTNEKVNVLCYPVGKYNDRVIDIVKKYYDYAVTTKYGFYKPDDDKYTINRIYIKRDDNINAFLQKIK